MKAISKIIFPILFYSSIYATEPISHYKQIADKDLLRYFEKKLVQRIKCQVVTIIDGTGSDRFYYSDKISSKKVKFEKITFQYSFYSEELKDKLFFFIAVGSNSKVLWDSSVIKRIPECIRKMKSCKFINSSEAKSIAVRDSIDYPTNLRAQLELNKNDHEYYWIIRGEKKEEPRPANSNRPIIRSSVVTSSMLRIVNAKTGKIIDHKQFEHDW